MRRSRYTSLAVLCLLYMVPLLAAMAKGSFARPGAWPLVLSAAGGAAGIALLALFRFRLRGHLRVFAVLASAVATAGIYAVYGTPLYEPGFATFASVLCAATIMYNRILVGAMAGGMVTVWGSSAAWLNEGPGVSILTVPVAGALIVVVMVLWQRRMRRLAENERMFRARARHALMRITSQERQLITMELRDLVIRSGALTALQAISTAERIDAELRESIRIAEAKLRDYIRSPGLTAPALVTAVSAARRRGISVRLLGIEARNSEAAIVGSGVVGALVAVLGALEEGDRVTIRQLYQPAAAAVSVLVESVGHAYRLLFDASGATVGQAANSILRSVE